MSHTNILMPIALPKRLIGGLLSILVGWCVFYVLILFISPTCRHLFFEDGLLNGLSHTYYLARRGTLAVRNIAISTNIAFLFIYVYTPRSLAVWKWQWSAFWGVVSGLMLGFIITGIPMSYGVHIFTILTGGITCLVASLINQRLERKHQTEQRASIDAAAHRE